MSGLVDKEKERARLEKQALKLGKDIEVLEKRLSGSNFAEKVCVSKALCTLESHRPLMKTELARKSQGVVFPRGRRAFTNENRVPPRFFPSCPPPSEVDVVPGSGA